LLLTLVEVQTFPVTIPARNIADKHPMVL